MKNIFKNFYSILNKSPFLRIISIVGSICLISLAVITIAKAPEKKAADKMTALRLAALSSPETITKSETEISPESETTSVPVFSVSMNDSDTYGTPVQTSETYISDSDTTTALTTETSSTSSETTTTNTPHSYDYSYISAGDSPNSSFYQDRLTVIGDSIASGFNAYGYIPYEHNLAQGSLSLWNMDGFTFDVNGYYMGLLDAADTINAPLYYVSIGMNDIYAYTANDYAYNMTSFIQQLQERIPTATIIVGAITPVSEDNYYTDNYSIREFNSALQTSIESIGSNQIIFFDTYSILANPYTLALNYEDSGGDGLHLSSDCYEYVLKCLFNFLDSTDAKSQIDIHDTTGY